MKHLQSYKLLCEGRDFIPNSDSIKDIDDILLDLRDEEFGVNRDISPSNKKITVSIYKLVKGVQTAFNINSIKDVALRLGNYAKLEGYVIEMHKDNKFSENFDFSNFPQVGSRNMEMIWHFTIKIINR